MFEKTKARIAKMEEDHDSLRKVHQHVRDNKTMYIAVGIAIPTSFMIGKHFQRPIVIDFQPTINNTPVFNNHNIGNVVENTVNNTVNNGGHMAKIVKAIMPDGTELIFESSGDAAKMLAETVGIPLDRAQWWVSRCANGKIHDAFQHQFENIGLRTTS